VRLSRRWAQGLSARGLGVLPLAVNPRATASATGSGTADYRDRRRDRDAQSIRVSLPEAVPLARASGCFTLEF
jgi:hypothetical protein